MTAGAGREVAPNVRAVANLFYGDCVYIIVERELTLIDAGLAPGARRVLRTIARLGRAPRDLRRIVLTHRHLDHTGGAAVLQRLSGAAVIAHRLEVEAIEGRGDPALAHYQSRPLADLRWGSRGFTPVRVDCAVEDGDIIPALGGLRVVHTPGHTPGHISLYQPERRLLFTGDTLTNDWRLGPSLRVFTLDPPEALRSIVLLSRLDVETVLFSHGRPLRHDVRARLARLAERYDTGETVA